MVAKYLDFHLSKYFLNIKDRNLGYARLITSLNNKNIEKSASANNIEQESTSATTFISLMLSEYLPTVIYVYSDCQ